MTRDAEYYGVLIRQNAGATVSFVLAANAVYAAKFGLCDSEQIMDREWLSIAGKLKKTYGNYLTADKVLAEMKSSRCRQPEQ
jgi:hypothetical protein